MTGKPHERAINQGKLFPATGKRKPLPRPRALELAALVLTGSSEPTAFSRNFAGTDTSVVDYLCDMVLSQMDERTRDTP